MAAETPRDRYDRANTTQVKLKLNLKTDADILARLGEVKSKQGYIKELIRKDMEDKKMEMKYRVTHMVTVNGGMGVGEEWGDFATIEDARERMNEIAEQYEGGHDLSKRVTKVEVFVEEINWNEDEEEYDYGETVDSVVAFKR